MPDEPNDPLIDEEFEEREAKDGPGLRGVIPEFVRKVAVAGLGAVFMTEEGLRSLSAQLKLPKEALGFVVAQAEKTKDEIGRVVSEEVRRFMQSDKLRDEFLKLLGGMTVEIKAEVKLVPDKLRASGEAPSLLPKVVVSELKAKHSSKKKKDPE